jgi:formylglycine-generating enzyme required for sulfatase activity
VSLVQGGQLSAVERARAGEALAALGDPRFDAEAWWLPKEGALGFVEVPAGKFWMGSDKAIDPGAFDDELPGHEVDLAGYWIGKYPVTVAQFRAFVEDSGHRPEDGYCLRGVANHPVVSVTWDEAMRYSEWLTEKLGGWGSTPEPLATLLRKGWRVTLPSEAEWEKAARGADGRVYPWGNDADPQRANYHETGIYTTSTGSKINQQEASPNTTLEIS